MTNHELVEPVATTFNIINIMKLRDHLAKLADPSTPKPKIGFNMRTFDFSAFGVDRSPHHCGTACCIAGHVAIVGGMKEGLDIEWFARNWLGLTKREARDLFYGDFSYECLSNITLEEAIAALDHMIMHGEVPVCGRD